MKENDDVLMCGDLRPPKIDTELRPTLATRNDGKALCTRLKNARKKLADANGIPYELEPCPNEGPCAGTCEKCDEELEYLNKQMKKIPEEKRVFPDMNIDPFRSSEKCKSSPKNIDTYKMGRFSVPMN